MPERPKRFCTHPGCSELTSSSKCDKHRIDYKEQRRHYDRTRRPEYRSLYNTRQWQSVRRIVLTENPFCVECEKQGRVTRATDVDHIQDHIGDINLFFDRDNLQGLCQACHSSKTAKTRGFAKEK